MLLFNRKRMRCLPKEWEEFVFEPKRRIQFFQSIEVRKGYTRHMLDILITSRRYKMSFERENLSEYVVSTSIFGKRLFYNWH